MGDFHCCNFFMICLCLITASLLSHFHKVEKWLKVLIYKILSPINYITFLNNTKHIFKEDFYFHTWVVFCCFCCKFCHNCTTQKSGFTASVSLCVQTSSTLQLILANICLKVQYVYLKSQSLL